MTNTIHNPIYGISVHGPDEEGMMHLRVKNHPDHSNADANFFVKEGTICAQVLEILRNEIKEFIEVDKTS